ncbi:unannotated protein [freshwater metagenome]|uniref:Unannotated protein n=1 Tax=freshwater metagenome TaxID=449393 RepID=A0A6J7KD43_9ZZZZ
MNTSPDPGTTTIAAHLVRRFHELNVEEGFGIVGDYALRLFHDLHQEGFPLLIMGDEQGAAFAADAYARLRGLGVVAVTYGVGGLKVVNAVAGAWAEQVPLLVISGSPGKAERAGDALIHHKVKEFDTQHRVFRDLTQADAVLDNPLTSAVEIDRVLVAMLAHQRPGYLEIPRDMVDVPIRDVMGDLQRTLPPVNEARLAAAVSDVMSRLRLSESAVAMAGVMAWRRDLSDSLNAFVTAAGIPVATSSLSKGFFDERHPLSLGVYMGAVSPLAVVERVESADVILSLGVMNSDLTLGGFTAVLDPARLIECTDTEVHVGLHTYRQVPLHAFLPALAAAASQGRLGLDHTIPSYAHGYVATPGKALSVESVMQCVGAAIDERHGLLIEIGECVFASVDMPAPAWSLSSAYYATMGYAIPAAVGAGRADRSRRPVVIVGDGGFLMSGLEVMFAPYHDVSPIIVVLDNDGYGTQRPMLDGPFNDLPPMRHEDLPRVFGTGRGVVCDTENELAVAMAEAVRDEELVIVHVRVPRGVPSHALTRLTDALKKRV